MAVAPLPDDYEIVRELVARTTARCCVPEQIEDENVIIQIAAHLHEDDRG
jgi:hypothetical protein